MAASSALARWRKRWLPSPALEDWRFTDVSAEAAGTEVVSMAGTANFAVDDAA